MKKFKVEQTSEIIKAFETSTYIVEAETEDEAIEMIHSGEVDCEDCDIDVRDTEFMHREIDLVD